MNISFEGLTSSEVDERIKKGLINSDIPESIKSFKDIFFENAFNVFNIVNILVISFILFFYFRTSDFRLVLDCVGIFFVTFFNTGLAIYQENKAIKTLEKLNLLKQKQVIVIRDNSFKEINKDEIVQDDVIFLKSGEQIPVDGVILKSNLLEIDESLLTGESFPVIKNSGDEILSGSFCLYGNGYYKAVKVGKQSYASQVTGTAKKYKFNSSPLLKKINIVFIAFFIAAIVMVLIEIFFSLNIQSFDVNNIRRIATLATFLLPEGLIFFSTLTFMIGIIRIVKLGVIVQKINAIDSFATIDVVCLDKTGTLTKNIIKLNEIKFLSHIISEEEIKKLLGTFYALSSEKNATLKALSNMEYFPDAELVSEMPFRSENKYSIVKFRRNDEIYSLVLGGLDVLGNKYQADNPGNRNLLFGLIKNEPDLSDIEPLCIVSLKDEAREDAAGALKLFKEKNIQIKILSGDSKESVLSTLKDINWDVSEDDVIDGNILEREKQNISEIVKKTIFVRLTPEQKLNIVKELKRQGFQTAFIGDGVNDLPSIKESDLGIAMEEGSEISKETADIVLLNNKFSILPQIFDEGNKIINSISVISKLVSIKNLILIFLAISGWLGIIYFGISPRNASLWSLFSISIPAYIVSIKNSNTQFKKHFFKDLIYYSVLSSVIAAATIIITYVLVESANLPEQTLTGVLLTMIILISILIFNNTLALTDNRNTKSYLVFSACSIIFYLLTSTYLTTVPVINIVTNFYEINELWFKEWKYILAGLIPGSIILTLIQYLYYKKKF